MQLSISFGKQSKRRICFLQLFNLALSYAAYWQARSPLYPNKTARLLLKIKEKVVKSLVTFLPGLSSLIQVLDLSYRYFMHRVNFSGAFAVTARRGVNKTAKDFQIMVGSCSINTKSSPAGFSSDIIFTIAYSLAAKSLKPRVQKSKVFFCHYRLSIV